MKKFCIVMLAILFVAGVVSEVVAEDRLKLSGSFRARAFYTDNSTADFGDFATYDDNNDAADQQWFDQRLRVQGRINVAEGISANFRIDLSEAQWGRQTTTSRGGGGGWNRANVGTPTIQVDRAYGRWDREMFTLSVGQDFTSLGNLGVYSANQFGVILRVKTPVVFDLVYNKLDEGGALTDEDIAGVNTEDTDLFGAQATFKQDNWSAGVLAATFNDNKDADDSPWVLGAFGSADLGPLALKAEFDMFGGDQGDQDYKGAQVWGNAQYNIMSNLFVGAHLWYAASQDGDDVQITGLSYTNAYFADLGPFNGDLLPLTQISSFVGGTTPVIFEFDPSGQGAGAVGGTVYAGWRIFEPLLLEGQYLYVTPDDTGETPLNHVHLVGLNLSYDVFPNTTLAGSWNWHLPDVDNVSTDPANLLVARIQMTF